MGLLVFFTYPKASLYFFDVAAPPPCCRASIEPKVLTVRLQSLTLIAEIEAINKALVRKTAMGEDIVIPEVSVEDICHSGIDPHPMNPFTGEARTPDEIKRIHQEYDIPFDEDETDEDEDYGEALLGDIIPPEELIHGKLELPEILGGIICDPNNDGDDDESEE